MRSNLSSPRFILPVFMFLLIAGAWIYGYLASSYDAASMVSTVLPDTERAKVNGKLCVAIGSNDEVVGYAAVESAPGYAGPIEVLVGLGTDGEIKGFKVLESRESPGFFLDT